MGKLLGDTIAFTQMEKGIKNPQLAEMTGLSVSHLHRIEDGEREASFQTLEKIAKALDMDINELIKVQTIDRGYTSMLGEDKNKDRDPRSKDEIAQTIIGYFDKLSKMDLSQLLGLIEAYYPQVLVSGNGP